MAYGMTKTKRLLTEKQRMHRGTSSIDLSVVIPCHNEGVLLKRSVQSALSQQTPIDFKYEILLVLDNPDNATEKVVQELADVAYIRVIRNKGKPGPGGARNAGIRACRGEWVALVDGDDELMPGSLASRWQIVQEQGEKVALIGSDVVDVGLTGQRTTFFTKHNLPGWLRKEASEADYVQLKRPIALLCDTNFLCTNGMMFRRSLFLSLGGFDERLWRGEDTHMWLRLASKVDLYFVPKPLAYYYRREASISDGKDPIQVWARRVFEDLLQDNTLRPYRFAIRKRLGLINRRLCRVYRERGAWNLAIASAIQAIRWDVKKREAWKLLVLSVLHRA
jgi:glycosyltransferase involved in cell wall biosynthesis